MRFMIYFLLACATIISTSASAQTIKNTFESDRFRYLASKYDQAARLAKIENGYLAVTVNSGTYSSSSDGPASTERVEVAQKSRGLWIKQSARVRVPVGFRASSRTLIMQIKADTSAGFSPAAAVYLSNGGEVKCVDYRGAVQKSDRSKLRHNVVRIPKRTANLLDGKWHQIEMRLYRSDSEGYCRITVDGKVITERRGHDSMEADTKKYVGRIGIYRDVVPYSQTVHFDDWIVSSSNKPLW